MIKDFLVALSLSNLCFLGSWKVLLNSSYFHQTAYPTLTEIAALSLDILLFAGLLLAAFRLARRCGNALILKLARGLFLLLLVLPLNALRMDVDNLIVNKLTHTFTIGGSVFLSAIFLCLCACVLTYRFGTVVRVAVASVLILSPLLAVTLAHAVWLASQHRNDARATANEITFSSRVPQDHKRAMRILWMVFDEMDERVAFAERPASIKLPELDRLRREAIFAANALPPAGATLLSMPALITGRLVSAAQPDNSNDLLLTFSGSTEKVAWSAQPNVFSHARAAGYTTALIGWYHPYCRVIGSSLTTCFSEAMNADSGLRESGFYGDMLAQMRHAALSIPYAQRYFEIERRDHTSEYKIILEQARAAAIDPRLDLILIHWPVPHPPGIYNRAKNSFSLAEDASYLDNLELADRTLGELRREMEQAGTWNQTNVLVTTDHWWRQNVWRPTRFWTAGDAMAASAQIDHRVPFILKLAAQTQGISYAPSFNTVITGDLFLALLNDELSDTQSVTKWLDQHRFIQDGIY
jgi:hypothetical protein